MEVEQTESVKGPHGLSVSDGAQVQIEQAVALRGILFVLILVCFIAIGLLFGGSEMVTVGALTPGSREWLHYHFFHLPGGLGHQ